MSKQQILMVVAMCFVLMGAVAAGIPHEPKPDSVVGCFVAGGQYKVTALTVPESIDESSCTPFSDNSCSPCIRSLENQGCEVVEPVRTTDVAAQVSQTASSVYSSFRRSYCLVRNRRRPILLQTMRNPSGGTFGSRATPSFYPKRYLRFL